MTTLVMQVLLIKWMLCKQLAFEITLIFGSKSGMGISVLPVQEHLVLISHISNYECVEKVCHLT